MISAIETAPVMTLRPQEVESLVDALQAYHAIYSPLFQRRERRQWSANSLRGLLLEIRRQSIEPMVLALHGACVVGARSQAESRAPLRGTTRG